MRLNPEKSAEVIVPALTRERPGRTERYGGEYRWVSQRKRRKQKTSKEGCLRKVGLEAREEVGVQSAPLANTHGKAQSRERTADLMERILDRDNLNRAVKRVIRNKGSHGIDGMQVDELLPYLKEHGLSMVSELGAGNYRPQPVRKVAIPKPDGGKRELGIPTVIDRFVQQAVAQANGSVRAGILGFQLWIPSGPECSYGSGNSPGTYQRRLPVCGGH